MPTLEEIRKQLQSKQPRLPFGREQSPIAEAQPQPAGDSTIQPQPEAPTAAPRLGKRRVNLVTRLGKIIAGKLDADPILAARGLVRVYQEQTGAEKEGGYTSHLNGVGFSAHDAEFGTRMAHEAIRWFNCEPGQRQYPRPFGPKLQPHITRLAKKYRGQLAQFMLEDRPEKALELFVESGDTIAAEYLRIRKGL